MNSVMTIAPSGRRTLSSWVRLLAFSLSATLSGVLAFGMVAGLGEVWMVAESVSAAVLVIAALWIGTWHGTQFSFPPLPHRRGQVPRSWSQSLFGVSLFGAAMGMGVLTRVTSGLVHFAFLLTLLHGDTSTGILAGVAFGLGRSSPVALAFVVPNYPKDPTSYTRMLSQQLPPSMRRAANLSALAVSAAVALALTVSGGSRG